jgi:cytoskeletal protein CcmA (bactofilin family)
MTKSLVRFFQTLALSLFFFGLALAPARAKTDLPVVADELDSLDDGPHFFADSKVNLDKDYTGTVYAVGGEVRLSGTIDGDLVVGAGSLMIDGSVLGDVYAAGGTVVVNGDIGGNLTVAGGEVRLAQSGEILGAVVGGAGTYRQEGNVLGDLQIGAKTLVLAGMVGQNARLEADKLTITDSAVIGENLAAEVGRESSVSDQAQISGERSVSVRPMTKRQEKLSPVAWSGKWLFNLIGRIIIMLIALGLFSETIKRAGSVFDRRWPDALWKGAAFVVLVPFGILTLMLTIIGLPAAMLVGMLYFLILLTAWVVPGYWLGRLLMPKVSRYAQGTVGAVIISLVVSLPILGWAVMLLLAVLGTGALLDLWRRAK